MDTHYLVVGAGAMGMAFVDVLLTETDATVVLVDRYDKPGGHWNHAYPHVRLHQPSAFYGVNSRQLGTNTIDQTGWNAGLAELASGAEVLAYYDHVMHQQFLPSGRVSYHPMSEFVGANDQVGSFRSLVSGQVHEVTAKRIVDATYMKVKVPSQTPPSYEVADGVLFGPPNDLPTLSESADDFVVVGAGKTGADACLWLLANGVDPASIRWIMPRDSWYLNRVGIQPDDESRLAFGRSFEVVAASTSVDDLFDRLEAAGGLLRLDPDVAPTMYRCNTVTMAEMEQLRRLPKENIIRQGRVQHIATDRIVLDDGDIPSTPATLHIDCTADGLATRPVVPVFAEHRITLQTVRHCQQVFSAAFIAHIEAAYGDDATRNELCTVVPHPDTHMDWLRTTLAAMANMGRWSVDPDLVQWMAEARLDDFSSPNAPELDPAAAEALMATALTAAAKLQTYLEE